MSLIADLFIKLGFKADEFNKGIDQAKQKTSAFGSAMGKVGGMIAGAFAVGAIWNFGKTSMAAFNEAEQGAMRLLTALGGNSRALDMLSNQAKQLQKTTLFEDDETIAAQAAIAMLVKEADKIKILTPLVQDLATAKGIDLTQAGFMVAKAVEGSAVMLQRMGMTIEGTAGSADRFTSVVKELSKAVGGQAVNAANVGTGALTQMGVAFGNLKEAIGGGIAESGAFKGSVKNITGYLEDVTAIMESKYIPKWKKFWWIMSGKTGGAAGIEEDKKALDAKWQAELHPEEKTTKKPKALTDAEQLSLRLKFLKQNIEDTKIAMATVDPNTEKWSEFDKELKTTTDELTELTNREKEAAKKIKAALKESYDDQVKLLQDKTNKLTSIETDKLRANANYQNEYNNNTSRLLIAQYEQEKILAKKFGQEIGDIDKKIAEERYRIKQEGPQLMVSNKPNVEVKYDPITGKNANGEQDPNALRTIPLPSIDDREAIRNLEQVKQFNQELNDAIRSGMAAAAVTFGVGIGNLMTGDMNVGEFGMSLLASVAGFMVQFGEQMIALAMANAVLALTMSNPMSWPLMLGAGIAVVAAGTALSNMSKKGLSGGGTSGGGGGASGYSGQQSGSTAKEALSGVVSFEIKGNVIQGVLNNTDRRNQNFK